MRKELIGLSKFLSLVLRHKPEVIGIKMDENGWVDVQELIGKTNTYQKKSLTKILLDEIVATNEKKRFAYSDNGLRIRASQGHSIDINLALKPQNNPPEYLYHGTADRFIPSIQKKGLKKMNRNHVHLSSDDITAVRVGQRHGKPKILRIKAGEMQKDRIDFFLSDNSVWLVDGVPLKYIEFDWSKK